MSDAYGQAGGGCIREARCEVTCEAQATDDLRLPVAVDLVAMCLMRVGMTAGGA